MKQRRVIYKKKMDSRPITSLLSILNNEEISNAEKRREIIRAVLEMTGLPRDAVRFTAQNAHGVEFMMPDGNIYYIDEDALDLRSLRRIIPADAEVTIDEPNFDHKVLLVLKSAAEPWFEHQECEKMRVRIAQLEAEIAALRRFPAVNSGPMRRSMVRRRRGRGPQ